MRVGVEFVEWDRPALEEAVLGIVGFYSKKLAVLGTNSWTRFALQGLLPILRGQSAKSVELLSEGFNLTFHGPKPTAKPIIEGDAVIWRQSEPRFTFEQWNFNHLRPSLRTLIHRANEGVAEDAAGFFDLDINRYPFVVTFPKRS